MPASEVEGRIIVNTILWYIHGRMDFMPFKLLSKLVKEYFQESDIKEAKKILFTAAASNDKRKKIRQGPRSSEFNIKDIYELFQDLSNAGDNNLSFVTASSRFPPLDIKNIDAMTLMKGLNCLKDKIGQLKNDRHVVEQDAELKQVVLDLKEEIHQLKKHVASAEDLTFLLYLVRSRISLMPQVLHLLLKY